MSVAQVTSLTNRGATTALRQLNKSNADMSNSIAQMSTGRRVVKASDDTAAYAISSKIAKEMVGREQANRNASQGSALLQVAAGGIEAITNALNRMKTLATMANSDTLSSSDRALANTEFLEVVNSINDIAGQTRWGGTALLEGAGTSTNAVDSVTAGAADGDITTSSGDLVSSINGVVQGAVSAASNAGGSADGTATAITSDNYIDLTVGNQTFRSANIALTNDGDTTVRFVDTENAANYFELDFHAGDGADNTVADVVNAISLYFDIAGGGSTFSSSYANQAYAFQVTDSASDTVSVDLENVTAAALGVSADQIDTEANAVTAQTNIDAALTTLNTQYAEIGAGQRKLELIMENNGIVLENLESAKGTFLDADPAKAMADFAKADLGANVSRAMLARANQMTMGIQQLVG